MKPLLVAALLVLAGGPFAAMAGMSEGQSAIERRDYTTALKEVRPLADRGNSEAQFLLGQMYAYGWGVPKDAQEAFRWYAEAANRGLPKARELLVKLCERDSDPTSVCAGIERARGLKPAELVRDGRTLCGKVVRQLEARLDKDPTEAVTRYRLLGYYYFNALGEIGAQKTIEARRRHLLWIIEHQPESEVADFVEASIAPTGSPLADPQTYAEGSRLWLQRVEKSNVPLAVYLRAAQYHQLHDKPQAERILLKAREQYANAGAEVDARLGYLYAMGVLGVSRLNHTGIPITASPEEAAGPFAAKARKVLEQSQAPHLVGIAGKILSQYGVMMRAFGTSRTGEMKLAETLLVRADKLQPENPFWAETLGQHLQHQSKLSPGGHDAAMLKRAFGYLEKGLGQTTDPDGRMHRLSDTAKLGFIVGEYTKAEKYARELLAFAEPHLNDEKYGAALHDGHMVLGRLALRNKSIAEAREHLLAAGKSAGGSTLTSFGPNMSLASDLLNQGEKQVVIDYLRLCKNFWSGPHTPIDGWIQVIERGRKPDFGPNMDY